MAIPSSCHGKGSSRTEIGNRTEENDSLLKESSHGPTVEPPDSFCINNFYPPSISHCCCETFPAQRSLSDYRKQESNCSLLNNLKSCNPKARPNKLPQIVIPSFHFLISPGHSLYKNYSYRSSAQFMGYFLKIVSLKPSFLFPKLAQPAYHFPFLAKGFLAFLLRFFFFLFLFHFFFFFFPCNSQFDIRHFSCSTTFFSPKGVPAIYLFRINRSGQAQFQRFMLAHFLKSFTLQQSSTISHTSW